MLPGPRHPCSRAPTFPTLTPFQLLASISLCLNRLPTFCLGHLCLPPWLICSLREKRKETPLSLPVPCPQDQGHFPGFRVASFMLATSPRFMLLANGPIVSSCPSLGSGTHSSEPPVGSLPSHLGPSPVDSISHVTSLRSLCPDVPMLRPCTAICHSAAAAVLSRLWVTHLLVSAM